MRPPHWFVLAPFLALGLACAHGTVAAPVAAAATAPAGPALPTGFDPQAIDAYVAAQVQARGFVGAQVAIVRRGELALERAYGTASLETGVPATTDTAFAIGSITKQFVCAAALLLAEDGKLSLDDRVAIHSPTLTRAADITLDDLGSHLSGYPDFYPLDFVDRRMQTPIDPDALIQRYATGPLDFEPRTRWSYSNTGFIVLGRIIEQRSGQPLDVFLRERVFDRVGMQHAWFTPRPDAPGLARGHLSFALGPAAPVAPEAEGWIHAAGGIYASAGDLARWDLALAGRELLSTTSWERMTTPRTLTDGRSTDYGCGIGVRWIAGETVLSHSGAVSGFSAYNALVPRTRSAVVLLVNTEGVNASELHQQLLTLVLGPSTDPPTVTGAPAETVVLELFRQLQLGRIDRSRLGEELNVFLDDVRLRDAAPRLAALGEPSKVIVTDRRERGGMEVVTARLVFETRVVRALLYRTPAGVVEEFMLLPE